MGRLVEMADHFDTSDLTTKLISQKKLNIRKRHPNANLLGI